MESVSTFLCIDKKMFEILEDAIEFLARLEYAKWLKVSQCEICVIRAIQRSWGCVIIYNALYQDFKVQKLVT